SGRTAGQPFSIWRESKAMNLGALGLELAHQLAAGHVPQEDRTLSAARCQKLALRRKSKDIQDAFAPFQFIQNLVVIRLPNEIARGQVFTIGGEGERSESRGTKMVQDLAGGNIPAAQILAAGD